MKSEDYLPVIEEYSSSTTLSKEEDYYESNNNKHKQRRRTTWNILRRPPPSSPPPPPPPPPPPISPTTNSGNKKKKSPLLSKIYMLYLACVASVIVTSSVSSRLISFFPFSKSSKATNTKPAAAAAAASARGEYYVEISDSSENILPPGFINAQTELPSLTDPTIKYGYCSIGAGLSGTVFVERATTLLGERSLIIDTRSHIGGNCYDFIDQKTGILRNQYGSHLFHTNIERVWDYITSNVRAPKWKRWYHYKYGQISNSQSNSRSSSSSLYVPIPPNIMTVNRLFDLDLQNETDFNEWLESVQIPCPPDTGCINAEQMAKSRVGEELYKLLFEGYTIKQWDKHPSELDASVTARIPIRSNFDPRYFNDKYQVLPSEGYTAWFSEMLNHPLIDVVLNIDFFDYKDHLESVCSKIIYTGPIDRYFNSTTTGYEKLEYRGIKFTEYRHYNHPGYILPTPVLNYPGMETNYTRAVEQKQYLEQESQHTIVVKETSTDAGAGDGDGDGDGDPYYPVPSKRNHELYAKYQTLATDLESSTGKIQFVGRLANYKYFNMDQAIDNALTLFYGGSSNQIHDYELLVNKVKESRRQFMIDEFYAKYKKSIDDAIFAKYQQPQQQQQQQSNKGEGYESNIPNECRGYFWQGEFGKELRVMVPWAYSKLKSCKAIVTQGNVGSKYLYFFSGYHKILQDDNKPRDGLSVLPRDNPFAPEDVHRSTIPDPLPNWDPPPYKEFFARPDIMNTVLVDKNKPLVVIQNKFNMEWDLPPINYLSEEVVRDLLDYLTPNYTVLYKRHTQPKLRDANEIDNYDKIDLNEKAMIRRHYPDVLLFEDFADHITDVNDFNLLLFAFMSISDRFISVQGGTAVVGSYFGGNNVIMIRKGHELIHGDYNYFRRFSGTNITQTTQYDEVLETVKSLF